MASAAYGSLPFREQIAFFRRKLGLQLLTNSWLDIWQQAHDHAFVVAGANREDLLADFAEAVRAAIEDGETLQQFRKRFDAIVAKHGWDYNGGRNWRSRVIYETNLRTSYAAGRFAQLQSIKSRMPYWQYVHSDAVMHPRPLHLAWNGLVLDADDPWWQTHFPPNGWGCQCTVRALGPRDMAKLGKTGPDPAPPVDMQQVTVGQRSPGGARVVDTPAGIDPGFGYEPGRAAWFRQRAEGAIAQAEQQAHAHWENLVATGPADFGRPQRIPLGIAPALLRGIVDTRAVVTALRDIMGGYQRVYDVQGIPVAVDAVTLGTHVPLDRARYLPLLADALENPWEVWMMPQRNPETGAVRIRARIIKGYDLGNGRGVIVVADEQGGQFVGWTFVYTRDMRYLNDQRAGTLWYGRP